ncbi:Rab-GTPase-TBC domain family protein [Babesia bovis T2Bo]|uniref:Rab-GAP TBC domain-containing protein n=1 Tax=Babesia bovis TaxID=5865 RepID=A7AMR4_BABBO|nr:Rab-GTPase-TBC domain family protein [Babesia bovis T2Bo]EDO07848.1 Rab-GTPase-TBC domain family protein [Babesia bovis T2Bo]|eukprot:XP_001611416.1 hypothetical protein [Babesia bovis T2Bo]
MLLTERFWELERKSSLFSRSGVHSLEELLALRPRVVALLGDQPNDGSVISFMIHYVTNLVSSCSLWDHSNSNKSVDTLATPLFTVTPENERIFQLDAERTFTNEEHREALCYNLQEAFSHVGNYHQGEGFVVAFLSLFLDTTDVVRLIVHLHEDPMSGYFSCMPEAYVRDSRVLMKLLEERNLKLHDHLSGLVVPEAFCSKWFIGMTIHVLPFTHVITYMERVISRGECYIFSFGLAFLLYHGDAILASNDVSHILALLRLDESILPSESESESIYNGILQMADEIEVESEKISQLRIDVAADMVRQKEQREQRMKELEASDDEIVFSDEE